jgi:predicted amidohydrolase
MEGFLNAAAVQTMSGDDKEVNLKSAVALVESAAADGAELVVLGELVNYLGPESGYAKNAEPIPGPTTNRFAEAAVRLGVAIVAGSILESAHVSDRYFNTSVVIDQSGEIVAKYRKIHLSDLQIGDEVSDEESRYILPGDHVVTVDLLGHRLGLSICRDMRFPELFRLLSARGADILVLPAAVPVSTGKDHWEILLRARAIENQCFLVAGTQYGRNVQGWNWSSYGRAMVIDPWGLVLATAPDGLGYAAARLDFGRLAQIRRELPALADRRVPVETTA